MEKKQQMYAVPGIFPLIKLLNYYNEKIINKKALDFTFLPVGSKQRVWLFRGRR